MSNRPVPAAQANILKGTIGKKKGTENEQKGHNETSVLSDNALILMGCLTDLPLFHPQPNM
jgi:hypothetical protein